MNSRAASVFVLLIFLLQMFSVITCEAEDASISTLPWRTIAVDGEVLDCMAVDDTDVMVVTRDGVEIKLSRVNISEGTLVWAAASKYKEVRRMDSVILENYVLFQISTGDRENGYYILQCYNSMSGALIWSKQTNDRYCSISGEILCNKEGIFTRFATNSDVIPLFQILPTSLNSLDTLDLRTGSISAGPPLPCVDYPCKIAFLEIFKPSEREGKDFVLGYFDGRLHKTPHGSKPTPTLHIISYSLENMEVNWLNSDLAVSRFIGNADIYEVYSQYKVLLHKGVLFLHDGDSVHSIDLDIGKKLEKSVSRLLFETCLLLPNGRALCKNNGKYQWFDMKSMKPGMVVDKRAFSEYEYYSSGNIWLQNANVIMKVTQELDITNSYVFKPGSQCFMMLDKLLVCGKKKIDIYNLADL